MQVWRSRLAVIELLLESGAPTDVQDAESGWCADRRAQQLTCAQLSVCMTTTCGCRTALHCALFYGNLQAAAQLLEAGAALAGPADFKARPQPSCC